MQHLIDLFAAMHPEVMLRSYLLYNPVEEMGLATNSDMILSHRDIDKFNHPTPTKKHTWFGPAHHVPTYLVYDWLGSSVLLLEVEDELHLERNAAFKCFS